MKTYIVQVQVTAKMEERAAILISHCIDAGVVVGNFLPGETAKVVNTFERADVKEDHAAIG